MAGRHSGRSASSRIADAVFGRRRGHRAARERYRSVPVRAAEAELDVEDGTLRYDGERYVPERRLAEVYRERAHLVALLATMLPSHIGYTDPETPGWPVVVAETPCGQLTWHVAPRDVPLFADVRPTRPGDARWDGHSTEEKYRRVRQLIAGFSSGALPAGR